MAYLSPADIFRVEMLFDKGRTQLEGFEADYTRARVLMRKKFGKKVYKTWPRPFRTLVDYSLTVVLEPYQVVQYEHHIQEVFSEKEFLRMTKEVDINSEPSQSGNETRMR